MNFEMMVLILSGKSAKVVAAVEKHLKPYVKVSRKYSQK